MFSNIHISTFCLLLAVMLFGCQDTEKPSPILANAPSVLAASDCEKGNVHWFPLQEVPTNSNDQHAGFFLSTSGYPFMYDDCLCRVTQLRIPIAEIPDIEDPVHIDYAGTEVLNHWVVYGPPGSFDTIIVTNPAEIDAPGLELMVTLKGQDYDATVGNAGGLCIVDNLSGTYTGEDTLTVFQFPWRLAAVPISDTVWNVYIPEVMTTPY